MERLTDNELEKLSIIADANLAIRHHDDARIIHKAINEILDLRAVIKNVRAEDRKAAEAKVLRDSCQGGLDLSSVYDDM